MSKNQNRKNKLAIVPVAPDKMLALPTFGWGTAPLAPISEKEADELTAVARFSRLETMRANCQNMADFKRDFILANQGEIRSFFNKFNNMGNKRPAQVDGKPLILDGKGISNKEQAAKAIWHCTYNYIASLVFPKPADAEAQPQAPTDATATEITIPDPQSPPQPVEDEGEEEKEKEDSTGPADAMDAEIVTSDVAETITGDQVTQEGVTPSATDTTPTYTASKPPARTDWEATFFSLDESERIDALRALLKVMKIDNVLGVVDAAVASAGKPVIPEEGRQEQVAGTSPFPDAPVPNAAPVTEGATGTVRQENRLALQENILQILKGAGTKGLKAMEIFKRVTALDDHRTLRQKEVITMLHSGDRWRRKGDRYVHPNPVQAEATPIKKRSAGHGPKRSKAKEAESDSAPAPIRLVADMSNRRNANPKESGVPGLTPPDSLGSQYYSIDR